jgi:DNA-binding transcriptional ArsR family regulator
MDRPTDAARHIASDDAAVSHMRATAHPVRLRILSLLTGAEMSAAEIARELAITHANASYHVRFLADAGLVVEAGEEKIRGGVAKRYRHPWNQTDMVGPKPTREDAVHYVRVMGDEMVRRYASREEGTRSFLTDAEMWVTPEVWARVEKLVQQASRLIHAEAQPPHTAGTIHVNLTATAFQMSRPHDTDEVP